MHPTRNRHYLSISFCSSKRFTEYAHNETKILLQFIIQFADRCLDMSVACLSTSDISRVRIERSTRLMDTEVREKEVKTTAKKQYVCINN